MPTISEKYLSGGGSIGQSAQSVYTAYVKFSYADMQSGVIGDDENSVRVWALPHFGNPIAGGKVLMNLHAEPMIRIPFGATAGMAMWRVDATYRYYTETRQTNDSAFSFSTGGGTYKATSAYPGSTSFGNLFTRNSGTVGLTQFPKSVLGTIGAKEDSVEGVDVGQTAFNFKTTFYIAEYNMNSAYVELLKKNTSAVNGDVVVMNVDGVTQTFQIGSLRMIGATGSKRRGMGDWELGLEWSFIPNVYPVVVSGQTLSAEGWNGVKNGWDYLDVKYALDKDKDAPVMTYQLDWWQIHQIYAYVPMGKILAPSGYSPADSLNQQMLNGAFVTPDINFPAPL